MTPVTVSLPTWQTPPSLLRRAIEAVLNQSWRELLLVVTIDGPDDLTRSWLYEWARAQHDPRLAIWERPTNRGRYWSDAVVLRATDGPIFAVHDADDAARPAWLETLVEALLDEPGAAAAFGGQLVHKLTSMTVAETPRRYDPARGLQHLAHMAGVYSRDWLTSIGGFHPGFRVGFDTLLTALPHLLGRPVATTDAVLYDRYKRAGSLTTSVQTGMRSTYRRQVAAALAALWDMIKDDDPSNAGLILAGYPSRQQYDQLDEQVEHEAATLRALLAMYAPAGETAEVTA